MHDIIERSVSIKYLWDIINNLLRDNKYIVWMIMTWKGWTTVQAFNNIQNKCKNNKSRVQPIDWLKIESMYEIIERSVSIYYFLNMIKDWWLNYQYIS